MKKTLLALFALALLTATAATAQTAAPAGAVTTAGTSATLNARHNRQMHPGGKGKGGPRSAAQKADRHAAKLAKDLGLNADQEAKVERILMAQHQEMSALKARYAGQPAAPGRRQAARPEVQAIRAKYDAQLKAALGPEQYTKLIARRAEKHEETEAKRDEKMEAKK